MRVCWKETDVEAWKRLLTPPQETGIVHKADEAMQGMLVLNGTGAKPYFVGNPPRWDENPFGVGGYTWTVSRLVYMTMLSQAYFITGRCDYMRKLTADLTDWLEKEPPPPIPVDHDSAMVYHGIHHWRMLEIGFRTTYTFPVLLTALWRYGAHDLLQRLLDCIHQHGERLYAGSGYLWPNKDHNHYLMEMVGLLAAAALLAQDPDASVWADHAMREIEECGFRQISPHGAQIEGSTTYHNDCISHFCMALLFAQQLEKSFTPAFCERIKKGIDYSVYTLRPNGQAAPIGDSDPDMLPVFGAARQGDALDCALYGLLLFRDERWVQAVRGIATRERLQAAAVHAWGFPHTDALLQLYAEIPDKKASFPLCSWQKETQQYCARTGWTPDACSLVFSCRSPVHYGCHGHIDPLSFDFCAYGKALLVDPGRFTYKDGEDRHLYKSSAVHNMPTLNGRDAFEYISTFAYAEQKEGRITRVNDTPRVKSAAAFHDNYAPARLERIIGIIDDRFLLILDTFRHAAGNRAQLHFHLNSVQVCSAPHAVCTEDEDVNLLLHSTIGEAQILDGRISDVFYHDYPSKRVVFGQQITQDVFSAATLAVPFRGPAADTVEQLTVCSDQQEIRFVLQGKPYRVSYADGIFEVIE